MRDRGLEVFVKPSERYLQTYGDKIRLPCDLAYRVEDKRREVLVEDLPSEQMFMDIGTRTIAEYAAVIQEAKTLFVNGPAGVYEEAAFEQGTRMLWQAVAKSRGYSVMGGGDTVTAAARFVDLDDIDYVCTAGGAMIRYLSGRRLPLIEAMERAYDRDIRARQEQPA